ncbi:MAG: carboxypeptidase regulatory-like domain-containing protein [Candidatus Acidiferrales bacterium]
MKIQQARGFTVGPMVVALALLLALCFALSPIAQAQSTAVLRGTVTDATGAGVPDAKVVVKNQGSGVEWNSQTDEAGLYAVPALPPGNYQITVTKEAFQTAILNDLILQVSTTFTQNIQLQVGKISQQVTITAETPAIDNSTVTIGQVVDQKTVQEIPLNGRHFLDLGFLTAGSVTAPANGFLSQPIRGQGSFAFNTAGQREDTVNIMINGINLNDMVQNQLVFQPSINTVAEFKVDNSVPSAQYGRNSGAIVNIATRSGSNDFHGEAFEFIRNSDLDARNYFNTVGVPQATLKRNNFGAALGGPIKTDKAHFFISYEGLRHRQGLAVNALVLNDAQLLQANTTGDAAVKALLPFIPGGNFTAANGNAFFRGSGVAPVNIDQGTADLDFELSSKDRLHGYFALQQDLRQEPLFPTVGDTLPGWGDTRQSRRQVVTVSEDHIFSPSFTNTFRIGYSRIHITFIPLQGLNSNDFNIDSGVDAPIGLAEINIGGTGALDFGGPTGEPQGRGDTTFVIGDTVNWLHGRHSVAAGIELRRFYNNNFGEDPSRFAFNSIDAFIADTPASYTLGGFTANRILSPTYDWFVEDSFKWRPNVTFQLGLRYSWYSTPTEAGDRFVVFDPATVSLNQIGTPGFGQPFHTNNLNFQPRVGVVWDPFSNGKTVVRAGFGILTDEPISGIVTGLNANPPFAQPLTATSGISLLNASTVAGFSGLAPTTINPNFDNPYVTEWNLNVEHQITPSLGLTVAYVGSEGTHLRVARNLNQLQLTSDATTCTDAGKPSAPCLLRPFPALAADSPIRPGAVLGNIVEADSPGTSSYNALWLTLNKRFAHGLQFNTSYTYSKSFDNVSQNNNVILLQDSTDLGGNRALSDFDVRNRFVFSGFYQLPFHSNRLTSGWQFGIINVLQSGNPLFVVTGITGFTGTTGSGALRPDIVGPVSVTGSPAQWFNGAANLVVPCTNAADATTCHFGDLGRNAFTGPRFWNTDFSVLKNTKITERFNLQFRADFFDIFNEANFGNPVLNIQSGAFGLITSTRFPGGDSGSSRQLQFALKLMF